MGSQIPMFQDYPIRHSNRTSAQVQRSGTFLDNMKLSVHRWFRYSAGFAAEWAQSTIKSLELGQSSLTFDPFAGSGTTLLAADAMRVRSVGIEAHPFVRRVCQAKLFWGTSSDLFIDRANLLLEMAQSDKGTEPNHPDLISRCYSPKALRQLDSLKRAWISTADDTPTSELVWLAITSILRPTASAGTAQWQYILPNKIKKNITEPFDAFLSQVGLMKSDMMLMKEEHDFTLAQIVFGDARKCDNISSNSIDVVITSPPYANNYDYADATRFEMSFWGEVQSWGDLHDAVRKNLIVSSSQHASIDKVELEKVLAREAVRPIRKALEDVCQNLATERLLHGGKKHYHTMIASYFADMGEAWRELRRVCKKTATVQFVIGDSAPYGIYVPVHEWFGQLALASGFQEHSFVKLRDRNIKWKNRKHRVPLQEGILTVTG
jgi:DNA modification methylase